MTVAAAAPVAANTIVARTNLLGAAADLRGSPSDWTTACSSPWSTAPIWGVLTYPSGHTTAMFALAAVVTVLLISPRPAKAGVLRVLIAAAACVLGGAVAIAVIGLRWHYFTDTVAGAAVGIGTVCGLALILDLPAIRLPGQAASEMARAGAANTVAGGTEARVAPGQDPPRED